MGLPIHPTARNIPEVHLQLSCPDLHMAVARAETDDQEIAGLHTAGWTAHRVGRDPDAAASAVRARLTKE